MQENSQTLPFYWYVAVDDTTQGRGGQEAAPMYKLKGQSLNICMAGSTQPQPFFVAGCLFTNFGMWVVSSKTLRFKRYRGRDLSRPQNFQDVKTETQQDSRIWRMSRPKHIETKKFTGCWDQDSLRLKNLEDVKTETDRHSPKGVKTETKSLATHWEEYFILKKEYD